MPVFEYRCAVCNSKFTLLVGMTSDSDDDRCPHCGSADIAKLVSKFTRGRTEDDRIDELADRLEVMGEPDSSAETRRLVREMGKAMDEDMSDDMEEMFEADASGESDE